MSGNVEDASCPTYAVVDLSKKKKKSSKNAGQCMSGDMALYAVVNKSKSNNHTDKAVEASLDANKLQEENESSIYSLLEHHSTSEGEPTKSAMLTETAKTSKTTEYSRLKIYLVVLSLAILFLLLALIICIALAFSRIARINSDLNDVQEGTAIMLSTVLKRELTLKSEIDRARNDSVNHFFSTSRNLQLIQRLNISSFENIVTVENIFNKADEAILRLIKQLNMSVLENDIKFNNVSIKVEESNSNMLSLINDLMVNNSGLERLIQTLTNQISNLNISLVEERNLIYEYIGLLANATLGYSFPAPSCEAIYQLNSSLTSGYYWLRSANGSSVRVYCEMNITCGRSRGGRMRVGQIDDSNRRDICTDKLRRLDNTNRCGIKAKMVGDCSSTIFNVKNVRYSHICGTVEGYGVGSPDGFKKHGSARPDNAGINDNYVDGISLTLDSPNTTHVWTFVAQHSGAVCPDWAPSYIGSNYSCLPFIRSNGAIINPPNVDSPHSFNRTLSQPTSDNIEMRLCRDQLRSDEDIVIGNVVIYIW